MREEETNHTNIRTEAIAGVTTFLTMAYIVVVNPAILSTEGTGITFDGALFGAGLFGSSSGTAYIESVAGIEMGGRTGLTSVFTALCFLPCLFIAPLAGMVPAYATSVVLLFVGVFMFRSVREISFQHLEDAVPAFLTIILIPLTFSITQGILWGFLSHVALYLIAGRYKEIHPMMYMLSVVSVGLLWLEHGKFS